MNRCQQNAPMQFWADSDSSSKKYRVRAFMPNEPDTCECTAFAIARNRAGGKNHGGVGMCKHIRRIRQDVCPWDENNNNPQTIPGICPICGGPTVADGNEPVVSELERKAVDDVTEKLLAMAAELEAAVESPDHMTETVDDLVRHLNN